LAAYFLSAHFICCLFLQISKKGVSLHPFSREDKEVEMPLLTLKT
jgi:hypothetical protein